MKERPGDLLSIYIAGEGLGSSKSGIANPISAGNVKDNNLGVGAHHPGEVTPEDDIYEQYKKRMMLGYRYRPNPLVISVPINHFYLVICSCLHAYHGGC